MTQRTDLTGDVWPAGLMTLMGLCDELAACPTLQSVCSDGNCDPHQVARVLAVTVMDYLGKLANGEELNR